MKDQALHIHFGPFVFAFICGQSGVSSFLLSHFETHLGGDKPDCSITISAVSGPRACGVVSPEGYKHITDGRAFNFGPDIMWGEWHKANGSFSLTARDWIFTPEHIWLFDRLVCRIFYTVLLEDKRPDRPSAIIVHSAGVAADRRGFLFFGGPGRGKSTVAALSAQYSVLHDDMNLLMINEGGLTVEGMPFNPKHIKKTRLRLPLSGLFSLHKSRRVHVEGGSFEELSAAILPELFLPLSAVSNNKAVAFVSLFGILQKLAAVSYYRLYFKKDSTFWPPLLRAAEKG